MFEQYPDIVSINEIMTMLNISKNTALKLVHNGEISAFRIGRSIKNPKVSVIEYVNKLIN